MAKGKTQEQGAGGQCGAGQRFSFVGISEGPDNAATLEPLVVHLRQGQVGAERFRELCDKGALKGGVVARENDRELQLGDAGFSALKHPNGELLLAWNGAMCGSVLASQALVRKCIKGGTDFRVGDCWTYALLPQYVRFRAFERCQHSISENQQVFAEVPRWIKDQGGAGRIQAKLSDLYAPQVIRLCAHLERFFGELAAEVHQLYFSAQAAAGIPDFEPSIPVPTMPNFLQLLSHIPEPHQGLLAARVKTLEKGGVGIPTCFVDSQARGSDFVCGKQSQTFLVPDALTPAVVVAFIVGVRDVLAHASPSAVGILTWEVRRAVRLGARALRDAGGAGSRQEQCGQDLAAWLDHAEFLMYSDLGRRGKDQGFEFSFHRESQAYARRLADTHRSAGSSHGESGRVGGEAHPDDRDELRAMFQGGPPGLDADQCSYGLTWLSKLARGAVTRCCDEVSQALVEIASEGHFMPSLHAIPRATCLYWLDGRCNWGSRCRKLHWGGVLSEEVSAVVRLKCLSGTKQDPQRAHKRMAALARTGNVAAMCHEGARFFHTKNFGPALRFLQEAAQQGDSRAQYYLGLCHLDGAGKGLRKDPGQARALFRRSAAQGDPRACFVLGQSLEAEGQLGEAVGWYRRAADQGEPRAQASLAWCLENGKGVERDDGLAAYWLVQAALLGNRSAQFQLAQCFESGGGVVGATPDRRLAEHWFARAAAQGHNRACAWWAKKGPGRRTSPAEVARGKQGAGLEDETRAQTRALVAHKLERDREAAPALVAAANACAREGNWAKAARLFKKAASLGSADAQLALGECRRRHAEAK